MIRTYVDTGVLIAACMGTSEIAEHALGILDDSNRIFAASEFLRLELLPIPTWRKFHDQVSFYEEFFQAVAEWAIVGQDLFSLAMNEATEHGLKALDALHLASAIALGCDELITSEKPTKPIFRTRRIPVISLVEDG